MIGSFNQGGSERQAVGLTRLLAKDSVFNVFLATLNREGALLEEAEALGFNDIPEFKLNSFYDVNFLAQIRKCARYLREKKIDIIHTHDFYSNVFGMFAAKLAGTPVRIASKRETGGVRSATQKRVEKFVFGLSDAVTVNSEAVRDHLIAVSVPAAKINVIYNGLDLERLKPSTVDRKAISESLGLPVDEAARFVTLVANLRHDVKNQPMFLRAAPRVSTEFPNTHFVIAGEGELRDTMEKLAQDLGIAKRVHFIGRCDRLGDLLSLSFAGVLTSFAEGFSNSIIEYMAAGIPVVATNVGGAGEAIEDGETGYLIESDDDAALAERLNHLLANEKQAQTMGDKGRTTARAKFSTGSQLSKITALYYRLLSKTA